MWKNLLFYDTFSNGGHFSSKGARNLMFLMPNFGPPSFIQKFLEKIKSGCLKHTEKKGVRNFGAPKLAEDPVHLRALTSIQSLREAIDDHRCKVLLLAGVKMRFPLQERSVSQHTFLHDPEYHSSKQ